MQLLCADVILGHDFLHHHSALKMPFNGTKSTLKICSLAAASVSPQLLFLNLTPDVHPIATKSRRYTEEDTKFIKDEVSKLLEAGIVEPSFSPWRAQVLVSKNENHKKRLVIDYSQTINRFTQLDAYPLPRIDEMVGKISSYNLFSTLDLRSAYHQIPIADHEKKYTAFEANK